ncbi:MAG: hypothetical protein AB7P40_20810 [Chloroflexota bacterium]
MTLGELLNTLAERGGRLIVSGERLRYHGPKLAPCDPARPALAAFRAELYWLVTAGRLCVQCPRLLAAGSKVSCEQHQRQISELSARNVRAVVQSRGRTSVLR